ncbi:putative ribonuclease H-like domain-containing protein [Tanacetum coccineum]
MERTAKRKVNTARPKAVNTARQTFAIVNAIRTNQGHPQTDDQGYVDSGCSRHMTGNMSYLLNFKEFNGGYVNFGGRAKGGRITGKRTLKTGKLDFEDVYSVKELKFTWVFFLASKDETSGILKNFITEIKKLVDKKVKIIRCDNGTEFKNKVTSEFCEKKGIRREFSVARSPQQNGVAERRNRKLINAARTMLANSKLPTTFWVEAVNTDCYVQNRVIIVKPHNKTPYELFRGRTPALSFMRPFGCHVTIFNTLDHLGKFDRKYDDGFFVGYSLTSKAFRVYNIRTRKVKENLHIRFLEDKPIVTGDGLKWLFDIDSLTKSINYVPVIVGTNSNDFTGSEESIGAGHSSKETKSSQDCIMIRLWKDNSLFDSSSKDASNDEPQPSNDAEKKDNEGGINNQEKPESSSSDVNSARLSINTASTNDNTGSLNINTASPTIPTISPEATYDDFFGDETKLDMSNLSTSYQVPTTPNTRIHKDHSLDHVETIEEELLQFKLPKVLILVDLPKGKRAIGTKWIFRNKKDERGIVTRNKARLVTQGYTQEECIDYDEVFASVARIEAIRLFLAYASFMGFMMSSIEELNFFLGLQVKQREDGIFISQDKYVADILRKFGFTDVRTASTPMDTKKPLLKDSDGDDVDVHLYRSMIGSLMYLTSSRPDIMFAVCACARFRVTRKVSHLHAVKRIFRYLKGQPKLGLWYPRNYPFDLVAYSDSDYAGASLDRKSTTGGCQFLGCRLISWQCKKQTMIATSSTEAEYVAATSCYGQVLWIQNQMLDYGYNFMHTMINIDNNSCICIVKNLVSHTKTKHIEIRYHFIRDYNDKKLIRVVKIHTDDNFADLLTKALDVGRFQYLIASIGMLNP